MKQSLKQVTLSFGLILSTSVMSIEQAQLQSLVSKMAVYQEDTFSYLLVDFNQDGLEDIFIKNMNINEFSFYLHEGNSYQPTSGAIGQYFEITSLVYIQELNQLGVIVRGRGVEKFNINLSYLSANQKKIITERIGRGCTEVALSEGCQPVTYKKYTTTSFFKNENEFHEKFYNRVSVKELTSNSNYQLLTSEKELAFNKYNVGKNVNFNVSMNIYRVSDNKTNEYLGYYDAFNDNFVSLQIIDEHEEENVNLTGPNFVVHETFGRNPVVRLKNAPSELPGSIVGAPTKEVEKSVQTAQETEVEVTQLTDQNKPIEKHSVEIKSENKSDNKSLRWLYLLLGLAGLVVIVVLFKKRLIKK